MIKLIILDRDGVINEDLERPIESVDEWVPIEGSLEAIARLHQNGWSVAVVTNQSGIGRGLLELSTLHDIHKRMHEMVNQAGGKIDVVAFCPHTDSDECACRKPAPGMLYTISERLGVELSNVVMVGDSLRDMQAAMAAAATPVIVKTGKGQKTLDTHKGLEHIHAFDDLASYVDQLLETEQDDALKAAEAKLNTGKSQSVKTTSSKAVAGKPSVNKSPASKVSSSKVAADNKTTSKSQSSKAQTTKKQTSKAQAGKSEAGKPQAGKAQTDKTQANENKASKKQAGKAQTGKAQTGKAQTGKAQTGKAQTGKAQTGKAQTGKAQTGKAQTGKAQASKAQTGTVQASKAQTGKTQTGKTQAGKAASSEKQGSKASEAKSQKSKPSTGKS